MTKKAAISNLTKLSVFLTAFVFVISIHNLALADYDAGELANQQGDRDTAFKEFYAAAQQKDARAYGKLASMYLYGLGTEKNHQEAYVWFHMSVLSGDRYATRFRDAATSMMSRQEYKKALEAAEEMRIKLQLNKP